MVDPFAGDGAGLDGAATRAQARPEQALQVVGFEFGAFGPAQRAAAVHALHQLQPLPGQRRHAGAVVMVAHARPGQHRAAVALEQLRQPRQVLAVEQVVARQVGDQVGTRQVQAAVEGAPQALVARIAHQAQARVLQPGRKHVQGVVLAAVVDDDGFPVGQRLGAQAAERARQEGGLLEARHQHAHARGAGGAMYGLMCGLMCRLMRGHGLDRLHGACLDKEMHVSLGLGLACGLCGISRLPGTVQLPDVPTCQTHGFQSEPAATAGRKPGARSQGCLSIILRGTFATVRRPYGAGGPGRAALHKVTLCKHLKH